MQSVLILDDDPGIRQTLTHALQSHKFNVTCAKSADEAKEHLAQKHYDLVLLDFAMPEHDGKWFLQNTRIPNKTKVLLITGHLQRDIINTMFSLGVSGYMIKPIDEETLIHNINFYLDTPLSIESDNSSPVLESGQIASQAAPAP